MSDMLYTVLVTGGRDFSDYALMCSALRGAEKEDGQPIDYIMHGGNGLPKGWRQMPEDELAAKITKGADALAHRYAIENRLQWVVFEADWDAYGKGAGPIRNSLMAKVIRNAKGRTRCIAFPGGDGTADMIGKIDRPDSNVPLTLIGWTA